MVGRAAILLRNKEVTMATAQQATSRHLSHNTKSVCGINFHPKVEGERTENRKKSSRKFKQKHVAMPLKTSLG